MTNHNHKKYDEDKIGINSVVAAVTGVVVGAGVAIAGAVALKDKKSREKVKKVLNNVKDQAIGYMENMQKQAEDKKDEVEEKLVEGKEKVKKVTNVAKDSLSQATKNIKKAANTK